MSEEEKEMPINQAMRVITQHINGTDEEIKRLTLSEKHLGDRVTMLTGTLRELEGQVFACREENRKLLASEKELSAKARDLTERSEKGDENLRRHAEEAEQKAATYEKQNDELKEKAALGDRLAEAGTKMADAIARLPTKMEQAALIRAAVVDIPLYNTYEWQAVIDANFLILRALGEPTQEKGE